MDRYSQQIHHRFSFLKKQVEQLRELHDDSKKLITRFAIKHRIVKAMKVVEKFEKNFKGHLNKKQPKKKKMSERYIF